MSEIIYRYFMRLYPPEYRQKYGADMLQNFRDMQRDKTKNLWLIIIKDLIVSIPIQNWEALQEAYNPRDPLRMDSTFVAAGLVLLLPFLTLLLLALILKEVHIMAFLRDLVNSIRKLL